MTTLKTNRINVLLHRIRNTTDINGTILSSSEPAIGLNINRSDLSLEIILNRIEAETLIKDIKRLLYNADKYGIDPIFDGIPQNDT